MKSFTLIFFLLASPDVQLGKLGGFETREACQGYVADFFRRYRIANDIPVSIGAKCERGNVGGRL